MATDWSELTGFQRDVLAVVARLERSSEKQYGLAIKRDIEDRYGSSINPGRLYQNLDELVALGLVDKQFYDGRTNRYRLTDDGVRVMQSYAIQLFADLDPELDGGAVPEPQDEQESRGEPKPQDGTDRQVSVSGGAR